MFTFSAELAQEMSKPSELLADFKVAQFDKMCQARLFWTWKRYSITPRRYPSKFQASDDIPEIVIHQSDTTEPLVPKECSSPKSGFEFLE